MTKYQLYSSFVKLYTNLVLNKYNISATIQIYDLLSKTILDITPDLDSILTDDTHHSILIIFEMDLTRKLQMFHNTYDSDYSYFFEEAYDDTFYKVIKYTPDVSYPMYKFKFINVDKVRDRIPQMIDEFNEYTKPCKINDLKIVNMSSNSSNIYLGPEIHSTPTFAMSIYSNCKDSYFFGTSELYEDILFLPVPTKK